MIGYKLRKVSTSATEYPLQLTRQTNAIHLTNLTNTKKHPKVKQHSWIHSRQELEILAFLVSSLEAE